MDHAPGGGYDAAAAAADPAALRAALAGALSDAQRMRAMADHHPALLWISDGTGACTHFNAAWLAWRGRTREQEYGDGWAEGVHPEDFDGCLATYLEHFAERTPFQMEYRLLRHDGVFRLILDAGAPWYHRDGSFAGFVGSCLDITDQVETRRALAASEALYAATVAELSEGVFVVDTAGRVLSLNDAAARMLRRRRVEVEGRVLHEVGVRDLLREDGRPLAWEDLPYAVVLRTGEPVSGVVVGSALPDGSRAWAQVSARPLFDPADGQLYAVVSSLVDVTDRKAMTDALAFQARHDPLTGLANRLELHECLRDVRGRTRRSGECVGVLFCDLDGFKGVNDRLGHGAGDDLLRTVAARLVAAVRSGDVVARVGGDEMVVVLDGVRDMDDAARVAEKVRTAVTLPVRLSGVVVVPSVSVGVSLLADGEDVDQGVRRADAAMYRAKQEGRDRVVVLAPG